MNILKIILISIIVISSSANASFDLFRDNQNLESEATIETAITSSFEVLDGKIIGGFYIVNGSKLYVDDIYFYTESKEAVNLVELGGYKQDREPENINYGVLGDKLAVEFGYSFQVDKNIVFNALRSDGEELFVKYRGCSDNLGICYDFKNVKIDNVVTNYEKGEVSYGEYFGILIASFLTGLILVGLSPCNLPLLPITYNVLERYSSKGVYYYSLGVFIAYMFLALVFDLLSVNIKNYLGDFYLQILVSLILITISLAGLGYIRLPFYDKLMNSANSKAGDVDLKSWNGLVAYGFFTALMLGSCAMPVVITAMNFDYELVFNDQAILYKYISLVLFSMGIVIPFFMVSTILKYVNATKIQHLSKLVNFSILLYGVYLLSISIYIYHIKKNNNEIYGIVGASYIGENYDNKKNKAKEIIYVTSDFCTYCNTMKEDIFYNDVFKKYMDDNGVKLAILDLTKDKKTKITAARKIEAISGKSFATPSIYYLEDGILKNEIVGLADKHDLIGILN